MSSSAEALPSPEFSTCPRCAQAYFPVHAEGCLPCRRLKSSGPRLVPSSKCIDDIERQWEADAATYYFLESFFGHPDP